MGLVYVNNMSRHLLSDTVRGTEGSAFPLAHDTQSVSCDSRCLCRGNISSNITDSNWFISVCYGNPHGNSPLNNYIFKLLARIYFALSMGTVDMIAHCYKWHIVSTRRERHCLH